MSATQRPAIAVIASLDSKAEEAAFLRDRLIADGHRVLSVDFGILGEPGHAPDIASTEVARRGGAELAELRRGGDRGGVIDAMIAGVEAVVADLYQRGELGGVIAIGGSGGTAVGTAAMRSLPFGVPKVMVSTVASGDVQPYVGAKDICMMNSVVDFSGLNPISESVLGNAAAAISGMVAARLRESAVRPSSTASKGMPLIAATMFGVTTPAVEKSRALLRKAGAMLVPFHATGIGGRTMESLIADGSFAGVLDLTTTEWADEVVGGTLSAGPTRLEAAAKAGVPQVIAPGALDMVNFVGAAGLPERFKGRLTHRHNANVVLMRTTPEENAEIGRRIAEKLNAAVGPVVVMFPLRGISALDIEGGVFFGPEADRTLLDTLRRHLLPSIRIEAFDAHINDDAFAEACCRELLNLLSVRKTETAHA